MGAHPHVLEKTQGSAIDVMKEKTLRILLVEDNAGDVRLAREMFSSKIGQWRLDAMSCRRQKTKTRQLLRCHLAANGPTVGRRSEARA
jgi:hypothetical protein